MCPCLYYDIYPVRHVIFSIITVFTITNVIYVSAIVTISPSKTKRMIALTVITCLPFLPYLHSYAEHTDYSFPCFTGHVLKAYLHLTTSNGTPPVIKVTYSNLVELSSRQS